MTERTLGLTWHRKPGEQPAHHTPAQHVPLTTSLWPERWPAIALQGCIEQVAQAPPEDRSQVKADLPCSTCREAPRCLNAKRKEIGSLMYDREVLTSPRTSESSLFPHDLMRPLLAHGEPCVPHWRKPLSMESDYQVVQAWDIAWSEKTGGDWLVCMTAYVHVSSGRRRLLDVERWRQKTFDQQMGLIESRWDAFQSDLVVIEGDAAQAIWRQQVAANTDVPVLSHSASDGKHSLQRGVPALLIKLENRKWEFPWQPGGYHHEEVSAFLDEMEAFGWVDGKLQGVGEHDDTVMAFWHLNWGIDWLLQSGPRERYMGLQPGRQA